MEQVDGKVVMRLSARAADRRSVSAPTLYRGLTFSEVMALAKSHDVECKCNDTEVVLQFRSSLA